MFNLFNNTATDNLRKLLKLQEEIHERDLRERDERIELLLEELAQARAEAARARRDEGVALGLARDLAEALAEEEAKAPALADSGLAPALGGRAV